MIIENDFDQKEAFIHKMKKFTRNLYSKIISTPIGDMMAVSDDQKLFLLDFLDGKHLHKKLEEIKQRFSCEILQSEEPPLLSIAKELHHYFSGELKNFLTPLDIAGTHFQKNAWLALQKVPYGETISYKSQAYSVNMPKSARAIANANGQNKFAIVIPCHRIVLSNGSLGGYSGGVQKKSWLIAHEKQNNY